ncbi:MAG: MCE family protein [Candidatus Rokubacteria bacterium]|nr:MCE family protein [Candidatus Rokubacteria bacterium]
MEPRSGLKVRVGLFVFAGLLLFATSIFLLGERGRFFSGQHRLTALFTSVAGLQEGATVRVAGVAVGRVIRIRLPTPPERKVVVELNVAGSAIDSVRGDSVARLATMGVMGDKFVEISVGSAHEPPLQAGATLRVEESADLAGLVGQGQQVLRHAERLGAALEQGEGLVPWLVNDSEGRRLLVETLTSLQAAAVSLTRGDGALPWLVHDPESKRLIAAALGSLGSVAASLERGDGALPWLVNDPESKRLITETLGSVRTVATALEHGDGALAWLIQDPASRRFVEDLGRTAETMAELSREVKEGRGLAHALIYDPAGGTMLEKASHALQEAQSLLHAIREGDGAIPALLFEPESRQLVESLTRASRDLEEITAKLGRGEGTLGALLVDPTVYEDLTSLLEGARRSWILRWAIRHTLESGRAAQNGPEKQGVDGGRGSFPPASPLMDTGRDRRTR